jgi:hypothetical protein
MPLLILSVRDSVFGDADLGCGDFDLEAGLGFEGKRRNTGEFALLACVFACCCCWFSCW